MNIKAVKAELSELKAVKNQIPESVMMSSNGITYSDPRPLKFCMDYGMLVKPTLKCCEHCSRGIPVIKILEEQREWFLDIKSGTVTETGDEESIPVTAFLKIVTVGNEKETRDRIIYDRFLGMIDCPRRTFCKP